MTRIDERFYGVNFFVYLSCRENFERVGTAVAAYLQYQKICSTNLAPYSIRSNVDDSLRNIQDLDEYSMQKFLSDTVGPIAEPTYRRFAIINNLSAGGRSCK